MLAVYRTLVDIYYLGDLIAINLKQNLIGAIKSYLKYKKMIWLVRFLTRSLLEGL